MPKPAPAPVQAMDRRVQVVIWAAMLGSMAMYYVVMRMVKPASPAATLNVALALALTSATLVGLSFLLKRRMAVRNGFIVALALCDAGAVLGLVSWFVTGSPLSYYALILGFGGVLLHYPVPPEQPE